MKDLLKGIYADLSDLAARSVYSDWLRAKVPERKLPFGLYPLDQCSKRAERLRDRRRQRHHRDRATRFRRSAPECSCGSASFDVQIQRLAGADRGGRGGGDTPPAGVGQSREHANCNADGYCDFSTNKCVALRPKGSACTSSQECDGRCSNNVCQ